MSPWIKHNDHSTLSTIRGHHILQSNTVDVKLYWSVRCFWDMQHPKKAALAKTNQSKWNYTNRKQSDKPDGNTRCRIVNTTCWWTCCPQSGPWGRWRYSLRWGMSWTSHPRGRGYGVIPRWGVLRHGCTPEPEPGRLPLLCCIQLHI